MTEWERYCAGGLHVRDTVTGACLECGDEKDPFAEHAELAAHQPPRGSVVMAEGSTGTAWQRFYGDGRWHSTTGKSTTWEKLLLGDRPGARLRIVYLPPFIREPRP